MIYSLLIFILANTGISVGITRSSLTEPIRKKIGTKVNKEKNNIFYWIYSLINCPLCFGFWSSIPVYFWVYNMPSIDFNLLAFMFIGSFTSFFLYKLSSLG